MIVVLPAPFSPTSAIRSPGVIVRSTCRIAQRSLPGYRKPTSSKTKPVRIGRGTGAAPGFEWMDGFISKKTKRSRR